jgi:hypothetical protein
MRFHWTYKQFAEFLGVSPSSGSRILRGDLWPHIPRPVGFVYPWPEQLDQSRLIPRAKVEEAFRRYKDENWALMDFVSFLNVTPVTGYAIFRGEIYSDIEKPAGLNQRTYRQRSRLRAKQGLRFMIQHNWSLEKLKDFLGVDGMISVYKLLERKTFPELFDELREDGWDVQAYIDANLQIPKRKSRS